LIKVEKMMSDVEKEDMSRWNKCFQHGDKVFFTQKNIIKDPPSGIYYITGMGIMGYPHFHQYKIIDDNSKIFGRRIHWVDVDQLEHYVEKPSWFEKIFEGIKKIKLFNIQEDNNGS
jgi:hypothetical protein